MVQWTPIYLLPRFTKCLCTAIFASSFFIRVSVSLCTWLFFTQPLKATCIHQDTLNTSAYIPKSKNVLTVLVYKKRQAEHIKWDHGDEVCLTTQDALFPFLFSVSNSSLVWNVLIPRNRYHAKLVKSNLGAREVAGMASCKENSGDARWVSHCSRFCETMCMKLEVQPVLDTPASWVPTV